MTNASRRGFLKLLPAVPVAVGALTAKARALTGAGVLDSAGLGAGPQSFAAVGVPMPDQPGLQGSALMRLLRKIGLPSWKRAEIRRMARYSRQIDPDLAALRSVSLSAMVRMQWQRNERRIEQEMYDNYDMGDARDEFMRRHNCGWF